MTPELLEALQSPACYPHATADITMLETHISWVLLTGDFAYKIKKPVNFGFLDFSTLARRKHCCEEELRLNSRFSTDLYLDVVAITGTADSPAMGGDGAVLEYAVKMRQFSQQDLLETLAAEKSLGAGDMQALAKTLAAFHMQWAARLKDDEKQLGSVESVIDAARENFRQIASKLATGEAREDLAKLQQWTEQQVSALKPVFAQRRADGYVRECHGDLHLRNIARIKGEMIFFDCIEFNPQLSWIDVQSELAFLLMDMEEKQLQALSNRLLNIYLEYTGDYAGLAVLNFYKGYRAMVRAKVLVLKREGATLTAAEEDKLWHEYHTYIRLAQTYREPAQPFLGLMHGVSGTGKSTVAATLAGECNAIRIRSDVERKRLFGLGPDDRSDDEAKQRIYSAEASARTFAALEELCAELLRLGYPVLVDATFIALKWRGLFMDLAGKHRVPFVIVDCQASPETIVQRLAQREATQHDASEAGVEVMRRQLGHTEPFSVEEQGHVLAVDTEQPVSADALKALVARLR